MRSKLKNMISGNVQEKTFRAGEKVDTAEIERSDMQYTYSEGDTYVFMDMQTYEETRLEKSDWAKFLKVEQMVSVVVWNGKVISVDLPKVVELEVTDTDPGVKGNTKDSGGSKPATLETGAVINVPLFINSPRSSRCRKWWERVRACRGAVFCPSRNATPSSAPPTR